MRVTVQVSAYYDWEKVEQDVVVTEKDVKSGRVKPAANGGYLMRVKKTADTYTQCFITESTIIARIIHEMMPLQGCVPHSRKEAIGQLLARNIMPDHAHPSFMRGFTVEDDGPDEKLFHDMVAPYQAAVHEASGQPLLPSDESFSELLAAYMEKVTPQEHVDHLHAKFNVKKPVAKQEVSK